MSPQYSMKVRSPWCTANVCTLNQGKRYYITISTKNMRVRRQLNKPILLYTSINIKFRIIITKNHSINPQTKKIISSHRWLHLKYTEFYFPLSFHYLSALLPAQVYVKTIIILVSLALFSPVSEIFRLYSILTKF